MKKVVSFSGGRTSAYLCKVMMDTFGQENVDFIFMDTGAEHPKTYEFIRRVNQHFCLNLVCLRGDFKPDEREIALDAVLESYYKDTETCDNKTASDHATV